MKESLFDALKQLLLDSLELTDAPKLDKIEKTSIKTEVYSPQEREPGPQSVDFLRPPQKEHFRVYSPDETEKLTLKSRELLYHLENTGELNAREREFIIEKAMSSKSSNVAIDELKWTVIGVLMEKMTIHDLLFLEFVLFPSNNETPQ